jgi:hypothetical protein
MRHSSILNSSILNSSSLKRCGSVTPNSSKAARSGGQDCPTRGRQAGGPARRPVLRSAVKNPSAWPGTVNGANDCRASVAFNCGAPWVS